MQNKILCKHCELHIGNKHVNPSKDSFLSSYKETHLIVPNKNGMITKTKVRGIVLVDKYSADEVGFIMETQFCCNICKKHTTVETINYN